MLYVAICKIKQDKIDFQVTMCEDVLPRIIRSISIEESISYQKWVQSPFFYSNLTILIYFSKADSTVS